MAGRITDQVLPSITAQWARAGRGTGNTQVVNAASQGLGDAIGQLAYTDYNNRMGDMMTAAGMAPTLDAARYADAEKLYGVGQLSQQMNQQQIDEAMQRFQFQQDQSSNALNEEMGALQGLGSMGGTQSTTSTASMSPLQMIAGGGLTLASLFSGGGLGGLTKSPFSFMLPWQTAK
jgi:hypothetical protein